VFQGSTPVVFFLKAIKAGIVKMGKSAGAIVWRQDNRKEGLRFSVQSNYLGQMNLC